jgi:hypothetical protein
MYSSGFCSSSQVESKLRDGASADRWTTRPPPYLPQRRLLRRCVLLLCLAALTSTALFVLTVPRVLVPAVDVGGRCRRHDDGEWLTPSPSSARRASQGVCRCCVCAARLSDAWKSRDGVAAVVGGRAAVLAARLLCDRRGRGRAAVARHASGFHCPRDVIIVITMLST